MKRVPTLAHDPFPNVMPAELSQPRFPNPNPDLNVYSTSLTPYACTCRDSVHMRRMLHLATLVLRGSFRYLSFHTFHFLLSTLYFLLSILCFVVSTLYIVYRAVGPCSDTHEHLDKSANK